MKNPLGQMMKQAQQMQEQMQEAQAALASIEVEGQAGGGMVKIKMSCRHEVNAIDIDPQLLNDDREMLEDILVAAFNDALRKVEATTKDKYSGLTSGLGLPAGLNLPF
ncbi:MAG: DNA-binding YbaB/EbfC family protein [Gammaproteobacteria bacterium]|jgi:DNA-binding YbaB/EbfC family protein|tara:strand:+ start:75 stop:398 length:324 start_codon:yes stop_codon:yes gene_type:complete